MSRVTDGDRERALRAVGYHESWTYAELSSHVHWPQRGTVDRVAETLADERERAYEAGWDEGWVAGNRDGLAEGMGDI